MTDILELPINVIVEQPALFCTLYHLSQGCGVIRLTFGEQLNGERRMRVAVSIPEEQARALAAALSTLFADTGPHQH